MKWHRLALALLVLAAAAGAFVAWREKMRPVREAAAVARARQAAAELAARPCPSLDALADRAHEDSLPASALDLPGLEDLGIVSLEPKQPALVWHKSKERNEIPRIAAAIRGEPPIGELGTVTWTDPPASFARCFSLGVARDETRVAVVFGRRRGTRVLLALVVVSSRIE